MATSVTNNSNNNKEVLQSQQQGEVEDESIKRNTDCIYFLASPLTCKKGSECEYRHSEYARVNPRDCWYWLNGNCLNPKCSFRHPPLEGFVGPQTGNFSAPPTLVSPAPPVPAAPQNPTKQGVPCIFFQNGYCLKGDRCPFMHGSNPASTKVQLQIPAKTATPEAPAFKKVSGSLEKSTQPKGNFNVNASKGLEAPAQVKVVPKVQSARPTNAQPVGRGYQPPSVAIEEVPSYNSSGNNGILKSRAGSAHHGGLSDDLNFQNGRDVDDSLRESSPGFDVLVDDKLSDDDYYHNEEQYARPRGHERRNLNKFGLDQDDYNSVADVDPERYHNQRGYDSFDRLPEKYAWDNHRASSERLFAEPAHYDRRGSYNKSQSPDFNQNSDLRQRLSSKQRRINGLKSAVNPDYNVDAHAEDRSYRSTRRDSRRSPVHEAARGHRILDRIRLPRSAQISGNDKYSERENEIGRNWGKSSPTRQQVSGRQSRIQDRLSGRNLDESREARRINDPMMRKDTFPANGFDFAGPKSLSELKGTKQTDSRQHQVKSQQSVVRGKLRDTILATSIGTDGDLSFEGPKPLSEILKRKRTGPSGDTNSGNKEEIKQPKNDAKLTSSVSNTENDTGKQITLPSAAEQAATAEVVNNPVTFEADEDGEISNKKIKLNGEEVSSLPNDEDNNDDSEVGEIEVAADGEEHEFDEEYDKGGEYEYEQDDGEGYNLNEVKTGEQELDSMDEDDGDDFAKALGVSF